MAITMDINLNQTLAPVMYIPHGGGPLPLFGDKGHLKLINFLSTVSQHFKRPSAILIISAHWEENNPTIINANKHSLFYDYYGFPEESYQVKYPVSGHPDLANEIFQLLEHNNLNPQLDNNRGLDHGVFVPLKLIYPNADIPCVQLSLLNSLDPLDHIKMGKALAELRKKNILIIGSGLSFHNMRALMAYPNNSNDLQNEAFQLWLINTCTDHDISETERMDKLTSWEKIPSARYAHPREEHLLPLHVCYGMCQNPAKLIFNDEILGEKACAFLWS